MTHSGENLREFHPGRITQIWTGEGPPAAGITEGIGQKQAVPLSREGLGPGRVPAVVLRHARAAVDVDDQWNRAADVARQRQQAFEVHSLNAPVDLLHDAVLAAGRALLINDTTASTT